MRRQLGASAVVSALTMLAACGGDGGMVSTPPPATPAPTAAPTPTPSPTPTPAAVFDTPEYRRSDGPAFHNAVAAWQVGATGKDVTIGIVDTGIDTSNPEFAGRISSASADVAGNRGIQPESEHGTDVALVAAAARNDSGVVGIAWQSTIMALRADSPGTCATANSSDPQSGCRFGDTAIAAGVDRATQNGAKVINLSLGGSPPAAGLQAAISRAAAAGVVVVVAAGNDADKPSSTVDPTNPDPFAMGLRAAGNGNVIIAGSVNDSGVISSFSNRAGSEASWYLMALGQSICCVYENGVIKTTTSNGQQFVYVFSGTSFSAPQIAGAAALLRQAFPNLTATQTVDLLLRTARDAGDPGTDATYGRGILDIARAFAPQGTTTLAGSSLQLAPADVTGTTSPAMGDAAQRASLSAVVLDSYARAYRLDLAHSLRGAQAQPRLAGALAGRMRDLSGGNDSLALAFAVDDHRLAGRVSPVGALRLVRSDADRAQVLAARAIAQLSPTLRLGLAYGQSGDGITRQLQGSDRPAFLLAGSPLTDTGFVRTGETSIAIRRDLGAWGLTLSGEQGHVADSSASWPGTPRRPRPALGTATRFGAALDRHLGPVDLALGASWLGEQHTILGGQFNPALVPGGADSLFLDLDAVWRPAEAWRLGASFRQAWTYPHGGGLLAPGSRLVSQGWSLDIARDGVFASDDRLALRITQPLRVSSGGLAFDLPTAYSYDTLAATSSAQRLSLVPQGREITGELSWRGRLWRGSAAASLFYRKNPGHRADMPDEKGVALSWSTGF